MRKEIDLPKSVIRELELQAKKIHAKMKFKPFAEMLLTEIATRKIYQPSKAKK